MKAFNFLILLYLITLSGAFGQDNLNVLVITGGHEFERTQFFEMMDSFENIDYQEVIQPEANQSYTSVADKYDAIIFYDMVQKITEEQKKDLLALTNEGIGMVFLHHSLVSYNHWDQFLQLIGGRYHQDAYQKDGKTIPGSTYRHDVQIPVKIEAQEHPVTNNLDDFILFDEVYGGFSVLPTVTPLLSTTHPESSEIIGWAHSYNNSRVVYLQPGHDHHAYENANYRTLVINAIRWVHQK